MIVKQFLPARLRALLVLTVAPVTWMLLSASPVEALTYGGSATGAAVTVPATGTTIRAATGTLSISGGGADAALLVGDIPGSVTGGVVSLAAGVMHTAIVGLDATRAQASMANVTLTISNNTITADFIMARATASCGPAVAGDSALPNLVINGQPITVTGSPNQTVSLPNGTVIINEQTSSIVGTSAEITVNALHVTTTDPITLQQLANAVLAQAAPQIDCQPGSPANGSFGTGGGWVLANDAVGHANFGVVGGIQPDGSYSGHIVFDDHSANTTIKSTAITFVGNSTPCQTDITATGEVNGTPGQTINVTIVDNGEPGAGRDQFSISAGYTNLFKTLNGGNVQKHNEPCGP